ncbi:MAG TPA: FAD-dependent oxidoreductase [Humibacter sp.]|nr:FAD-dependent oxidoreductase [Humibacter sp.]
MASDMLIVGGGLAAATAAETMRDEGFDGRIRIVAAEQDRPYIRPPLSKEYLTGAAERDSIFVHPADWYEQHDVQLSTGLTATAIDAAGHTVDLSDGSVARYDRLLLATGASPRALDAPGHDASGVHLLRTAGDSEALRSTIAEGGKRMVIVGSGWIGLEVASAARGYGNEVTVIGMEDQPLSVALGDDLGRVFRGLHEQNGVQLRLPEGFRSFEHSNGIVTGVVTEKTTLPADLVLIGIGAVPNVELAKAAGIEVQNGVLVDANLRTNAPDVFAAGDVANAFHPVLQQRMRNEHWANAIAGGKVAGRSMLGQDAVLDDIPYFYTDQFDLGMEWSGYPPLSKDADVVYRGDVDAREFIAFWVRDGRVVAGMNVNIWDVNDDIQGLIRSERAVDLDRLRDKDVPIADL